MKSNGVKINKKLTRGVKEVGGCDLIWGTSLHL